MSNVYNVTMASDCLVAGYLRHSLFPSGVAVYATDANILKLAAPLFNKNAPPFSQQLFDKKRAYDAALAAEAAKAAAAANLPNTPAEANAGTSSLTATTIAQPTPSSNSVSAI